MKGYLVALAVIFLACPPSVAMAQQETAKAEPKTQLERFLAKTGSIVVKVFHPLGNIPGLYSTSADLSAVVLYEPGNEAKRTRGIKIEVKGADRLTREHTSFLDLDEIDALLKALDYMGKVMTQWTGTPRDYTELIFSTRGDLQVGFYLKDGKIQEFVLSGTIGAATAYLQPIGLRTLREQLSVGRQYLESN
jgi:hypothetical protein